jgi:hypothetical protein
VDDRNKSSESIEDSNFSWSNLEDLEITKGELKHFSGIDLKGVPLYKVSTFRRAIKHQVWLEILFTSLIPVYFFLIKYILWAIFSDIDAVSSTNNEPIFSLIFSLLITIVIYAKLREYFKNRRVPKTLIPLLEEVSRYNQIAKIVEVQYQLEAAGNPRVLIDKKKIIKALALRRADVVRALKTERILRENKDIINIRPELFENNLASLSLRALDISDKAGESGQLINEVLQVAIGVQEEVKKLKNERR